MPSHNPVFARSEAFKSGGYATFDTRNAQPGTQYQPTPSPYAQQQATPEQLEELYQRPAAGPVQMGRMTYDDVVMRTGIMFVVLLATATVGWFIPALTLPGALIGLVLGLVNAFKKSPSPPLIIAYAAFQGLFVGGISSIFSTQWAGIVPQAVLATLAVFTVSLFAYKSGRVRVTPKSARIFIIALGGYLLFSLVNLGLMLFTDVGGEFGLRSGPLGFLIGLFAVGLAAYSLVMDFDFIEQGVKGGLPEKFAWMGAFGLMVTLIWLYVELLRLIAILRGED